MQSAGDRTSLTSTAQRMKGRSMGTGPSLCVLAEEARAVRGAWAAEGGRARRVNTGSLAFSPEGGPAPLRRRLAVKLAAIWLVVVIPASVVLGLTFAQWHAAQISLVEEQRLGDARLAGTSFRLMVNDMQRTMGAAGELILLGRGAPASSMLELQRLNRLFPVAYVAVSDMSGRVTMASPETVVGSDLSHDPAFRQALDSRDGGGLEPSERAMGRIGFDVAQRVSAPNGRPAGVMLMFVDVERLHTDFPVRVPIGGVSIVDSKGQVVFQNEDPNLALKRVNWSKRYPFVRRALEGHNETFAFARFPKGHLRAGGFVPIDKFGWAAGSSVDISEALGPFYRTLAVALGLGLLVAVVALATSIAIANGVRNSVLALAQDARRIGSGDLDEPVRTARSDEIGDVARSLERARCDLADARHQAAEELDTTRLLLEASTTLRTWTNVDALLSGLANIMLRATSHSRVTIGLLTADRSALELKTIVGVGPAQGGVFPLGHVSQPLREALRTGRTTMADYDALPENERGPSGRFDGRLALMVPLVVREHVIGHVGIDDPGERRDFTEREVRIAEAIASQAASAIENARLYESERSVAETLQTSLLSMPDSVPGVRYAHAYHSASEAARVGGDFYDIFEIEHDLVGLTIGDVAGKGLPSAVLTSLVKNTIRAHAVERGKTPAAIMRLTNGIAYRETDGETFVTAIFATLDCETGRLCYCNAGHTTGAVVGSEREVRKLRSNSTILGAFEDGEFEESDAWLHNGELLFLYTDGVTEARRRQELFGEERLFDLLADIGATEPEPLVDGVLHAVTEFTGGQLSDDVAILSLRRLAAAEEPTRREVEV